MNGTSEIFHRKNMTTTAEKEARSEIIYNVTVKLYVTAFINTDINYFF